MKKNDKEASVDPKKKQPLQPCTSAPSAEHARPHENDEPCDDGRKGITTEE